jgi:hypothetical protein
VTANYRPLLELADDLAGHQRYCGPEEERAAQKIEQAFAAERRKFVYELIGGGGSSEALLASIDRDLDRVAATGNHYEFAIDHVRADLHRHVAKQLGSSRPMQLLTRWGPPVGAAIAFAVVAYLRANR